VVVPSTETVPTPTIPTSTPSIKKPISSIPSLKIPSLKNMGTSNGSTEEKIVEVKEIVNPSIATPFTQEQFMQYWKTYAEKAYVEGKMTVNSLMTGFAPKLRPDYLIEVSIENSVQEELLKEEKVILLTYLREKLQNYSIDIIAVENTQVDTRKRLYTSTDKFNYLAEKNPNMIELKRRLDLEIDF
jgi:DNA polymerase-3 subunit gamma/tau